MKRVYAPASSANIGVGFDSTGIAIDIWNSVDFEPYDGLLIESDEAGFPIPRDESNLIYRAAAALAEYIGKKPAGMHIIQHNNIPHTRGLGSSSACIVAGLMIANELFGLPLAAEELAELATGLEGHPDNVAPAIFGGMCVSVHSEDGSLLTHHVPVHEGLAAAVMIPSFTLSTQVAREVLPREVPMASAISNAGRMGLLVAAMYSGELTMLGTALQDKLHEPYRKHLIPEYDDIVAISREAGAYGVCLSGAGPTMLAFYKAGDEAFKATLCEKLKDLKGGWQPKFANVSQRGAYIEEL